MKTTESPRDFLREHLREVPPFRALLRSVECELLVRQGAPFIRGPVLDLGCGDGHFASVAFEDPPFSGMDPDFGALLEAKTRKGHRGWVQACATSMPWADESFATVVANSVLEHIPDLDTALEELQRVLRSGGLLILTVPSDRFGEMLFGSWLPRLARLNRLANAYARWFNRRSRHYYTDSPEVWGRRLTNHGFETAACESYFPPRAHRVFDVCHYLNLPYLLNRKLTGKWVLLPNSWRRRVWRNLLKRYRDSSTLSEGAFLFIVARKADRSS